MADPMGPCGLCLLREMESHCRVGAEECYDQTWRCQDFGGSVGDICREARAEVGRQFRRLQQSRLAVMVAWLEQ